MRFHNFTFYNKIKFYLETLSINSSKILRKIQSQTSIKQKMLPVKSVFLLICLVASYAKAGKIQILEDEDIDHFVVYGEETDITDRPFQLSISILIHGKPIFNCGGIIISKEICCNHKSQTVNNSILT